MQESENIMWRTRYNLPFVVVKLQVTYTNDRSLENCDKFKQKRIEAKNGVKSIMHG